MCFCCLLAIYAVASHFRFFLLTLLSRSFILRPSSGAATTAAQEVDSPHHSHMYYRSERYERYYDALYSEELSGLIILETAPVRPIFSESGWSSLTVVLPYT